MHAKERNRIPVSLEEIRAILARDFQIVGESDEFSRVLEHCITVAPHDVTVLLIGETGTGKELIARTIHSLGRRLAGPFVPVDCASIPESLFADELFGHARGAFTDARHWRALGSREWQSLDARIIAATNEDLTALIDRGLFRKDLYFRLADAICTLPPLRQRREDISLLTRHFLNRFAKTFRKGVDISNDALMLLKKYPWPNNVRELQHCLQRALLHAHGPTLCCSDLSLLTRANGATDRQTDDSNDSSWKRARLHAIDMWEKAYLTEVLQRTHGNLSQIARDLSLSRMQLYRLQKKHGLHPDT